MREQSPNHSDPIPNAENWILVSDPFERPKVYRHINPLISFGDGAFCALYVYVIRAPKTPPVILNNIRELKMKEPLIKGGYFSLYIPPVLRLIINEEPVEICKVYPIITEEGEDYVSLTYLTNVCTGIENLHLLRNSLKDECPMRMKFEQKINPSYQEEIGFAYRGILDANGTLALRQAAALYDYFQGTP
jgi:hypothetical protein